MKKVKQLLFELDVKDELLKKYTDIIPYAFISFNPESLEAYNKEVLIFYTKEDFKKKAGVISYISDDMQEDIYMYKCSILN